MTEPPNLYYSRYAAAYKNAGFTNVETKALKDLDPNDTTHNGIVDSIKINEKNDFSSSSQDVTAYDIGEVLNDYGNKIDTVCEGKVTRKGDYYYVKDFYVSQ